MKTILQSIILSILFISYSFATTINVPADIDSIQGGIDLAVNGDTVLVADGTYYENIKFNGKAITVASQFIIDGDTSHISNTIIDGSQPSNPDSGTVVYFISGEDTTSVLYGFTITNGSGTINQSSSGYPIRGGGGILCWNSGGRIVSNKIMNNTLSDYNDVLGGGLSAGDIGSNAWVILEKNQIINNTANTILWGAFGGGVALTCNGKIVDNIISYNSCTSTAWEANGGGIKITAESELLPRTVLVKGNKITYNFAEGLKVTGHNGAKGGGIMNHFCKVIILENDILYNEVDAIANGDAYGAGISMAWAHNESLINANNIAFNTSANANINGGGGINISRSNISITKNIIHENSAQNGGGIRLHLNNSHIINNTIVNNTASSNGGGLYSEGSNVVVVNNIMWNNQASNGGGIYPTNLTYVTYSDIHGGYSGIGNINSDPLFSDTLYHLRTGSPCIDAGNPSTTCNDLDGTRNDMGAYGGITDSLMYHITGIDIKDDNLPKEFTLTQNFPNPFNPSTKIRYTLSKSEKVKIEVFNLLGQKIKTLLNKQMPSGSHEVEFTAKDLPSGVYLYRIEAGDFQEVKKMIIMK
jgi:type IX secretion system substrate protein